MRLSNAGLQAAGQSKRCPTLRGWAGITLRLYDRAACAGTARLNRLLTTKEKGCASGYLHAGRGSDHHREVGKEGSPITQYGYATQATPKSFPRGTPTV